jgi:DNA modification methylase
MHQKENGGEVTFTIHNCDIMDGFKSIPNNSIDLIVTSPPY